MAILTREQFLETIKAKIGDDSSDESLKFLEDMTDTYNDLSKNSAEDWKTRYEENDKEWRERYKSRFYNEETNVDPLPTPKPEEKTEEEVRAETVQIKDLFTDKKEG